MSRPPLILCSGTLGAVPLADKFAAAAAAGFDGASVYGPEVHAALDAGVDLAALVHDLDLMVAEVDGVVQSVRSMDGFDDALGIARRLGARSITVVETGEYDPSAIAHLDEAAAVFGEMCDRAEEHDVLVHIEPFAWSQLGRTADAAAIVSRAARPNGGVLLDFWHHVRGPDQGVLDASVPVDAVVAVQLADTVVAPGPSLRDECMRERRLPGEGHAELIRRLVELAAQGPLPPVGVEVFGEVPAGRTPTDVARAAFASTAAVLGAAGT